MQALLEKLERVKFTTKWARDELKLTVEIGGEKVGYMTWEDLRYADRGCNKDLDAAREMVWPTDDDDEDDYSPSVPTYYVAQSELEERFHNKGYGKQMYETSIKAIIEMAKRFGEGVALVVPGECSVSGSTTLEAKRVWTSLKRKYPNKGKVLIVGTPGG